MKKNSIKNVLLSGGSVNFRDMSICYLPDYYDNLIHRPGYQVHAEHRRLKDGIYSEIHFRLDEAVEKFLGLKEFCYGT